MTGSNAVESATGKSRAPRNRTLTLGDRGALRGRLRNASVSAGSMDGTIVGDCMEVMARMPPASVDLLVLDPPYNLDKSFGSRSFKRVPVDRYTDFLRAILRKAKPLLKPTASVYICGDWLSSTSIFVAASEQLIVRNRITWEREKGRGSLSNWKNCSEDIWFCTASNQYTFNVDAVRLRRRVVAPYRDAGGRPKDWQETQAGNFRDTCPSNLWHDVTVPFWSMPENTDHPTQKSEKLLAKLILASTHRGNLVFDPFLGSGTTSVVAKKLGRRYCGIEIDEEFALLAEHRLDLAERDPTIQGYSDNVFWERNSSPAARMAGRTSSAVP